MRRLLLAAWLIFSALAWNASTAGPLPSPSPMLLGASGTSVAASTLTIPSGKVASNLSNFPVMVNLADMPAPFWASVASDGGNVRVKQSGSVIPFDLIRINSGAHTGLLVFKAPSLLSASSNVFTIDLSGGALLPSTDTNGRNAVWSDYDIVVGFDGTTTDRTGASRTITGAFAAATVNTGFLKFADTGSGEQWDSMTTRTVYTVASSYYLTSAITHNNGIAEFGSSNADRQNLAVRSTVAVALWNPDDSWLQPTSTGGTVSTLYRAAGVLNNTTDRKLFLNGTLIGTDTGAATRPISGTKFKIGGSSGAGEFANAEIGYTYLRNGALTADWLAAEYASWHSPSTFYSVS
jgi:hypothetical protein